MEILHLAVFIVLYSTSNDSMRAGRAWRTVLAVLLVCVPTSRPRLNRTVELNFTIEPLETMWAHHYVSAVEPHLSTPQISSSLTFHSSFYWNKSAIFLLYSILLLLSLYPIPSLYLHFHPERMCASDCAVKPLYRGHRGDRSELSCLWRCPYFRGFNCTHVNVRDFKWGRVVVPC